MIATKIDIAKDRKRLVQQDPFHSLFILSFRKKVDFDDFKRVFIDLLKQESWQNEKGINSPYPCERLSHDLTLMSAAASSLKGESEKKMSNIAAVAADELRYTSTIRYLRAIWRTLNVGEDGFLDLHDLHSVCQGIGMSNTSDEVVNQLFVSLDEDMDGRVSFDELLHGILRHLGMQKIFRHRQRQHRRQRSRHAPASFAPNGSDVLLIRKSVSSSDITSSLSKEADLSDDEGKSADQQAGDRLHGRLMSRKRGKEGEKEVDPQNTPVSADSSPCSPSGLITAPLETSSISPSSSSVFPIRSSLRHTIPFLSSDFFHLRRAFSDADIVWSGDLS